MCAIAHRSFRTFSGCQVPRSLSLSRFSVLPSVAHRLERSLSPIIAIFISRSTSRSLRVRVDEEYSIWMRPNSSHPMNYKISTFLGKLPDRVITSTLGSFSCHRDGITVISRETGRRIPLGARY